MTSTQIRQSIGRAALVWTIAGLTIEVSGSTTVDMDAPGAEVGLMEIPPPLRDRADRLEVMLLRNANAALSSMPPDCPREEPLRVIARARRELHEIISDRIEALLLKRGRTRLACIAMGRGAE